MPTEAPPLRSGLLAYPKQNTMATLPSIDRLIDRAYLCLLEARNRNDDENATNYQAVIDGLLDERLSITDEVTT